MSAQKLTVPEVLPLMIRYAEKWFECGMFRPILSNDPTDTMIQRIIDDTRHSGRFPDQEAHTLALILKTMSRSQRSRLVREAVMFAEAK